MYYKRIFKPLMYINVQKNSGPTWTRTKDQRVMSPLL